MALINNKTILSVGIIRFDEEHSFLVDLTNQLHDAARCRDRDQLLEETLQQLSEFASNHFRAEEELLALHNYPGLEEQRLAHIELLERLSGIRGDFLNGGRAVQQQLLQFLLDWLTTHTKDVDRLYGPFLNSRGVY